MCFSCLLRVPLFWVYSPNYELFVCCELFHRKICIEIFADSLQHICISRRCHTEIHVALKYGEPCCATLLLTGNKWLMALITAACCWQIINKLPYMNIIPCRGLQVNYFPSFQTLLAIKHAESLGKLACILQHGVLITVKRGAVNSSIHVKFSCIKALHITKRNPICKHWPM
jgi:hypothetical protein